MFLVFGFDWYYPSGGWGDCMGVAPSVDMALNLIERDKADHYARDRYQIVDVASMSIIMEV